VGYLSQNEGREGGRAFCRGAGLSHFRSHRATRLAFDGRPVAIVGPNGAGKTNILEAVSLLSPGRGLRRAAAEDLARRPESLGWKISAQLFGIGGAHEVETWAEAAEARQTRIDGKAVTQVALARVLRVLWLVPAMDRLWIEAAEGRRRFLDRMTLSFAPDHAEAVLAYEKAMRDRNRLLKDQVRDPHWYAALEARMEETGRQITANRLRALDRIAAAQELAPKRSFPNPNCRSYIPKAIPRTWPLRWPKAAGATWRRGALWWARIGPIWPRSTRPRGWRPTSVPPESRRRCCSA
jgi:DNA replication and repair protein RecF